MSSLSDSATGLVNDVSQSLATMVAYDAAAAVSSLLTSFGASTEPDFRAVAPIYDRMLAVALLIAGAVMAFALIERLIGGPLGLSWSLIPRVLVAVFFAYAGLGVVEYLANSAALLATTWSGDLGLSAGPVSQGIATGGNAPMSGAGAPHVGIITVIFTAFLLGSMSILVHLELVVRAALILLVTAFIPIVCVLSIWPRLAPAAVHLGEFLVGLLLCKFVVVTAIAVGFNLIIPALVARPGSDNWMGNGVAVLLIAAFSPMVLFQALRFAHGAAGGLARGWVGAGISLVPIGSLMRVANGVIQPARPALSRAASAAKTRLPKVGRR